ncbi:MAG: putative toxin-antitoxin system toxin component, PIN family [Burkholderiales bacterium]|nr:putative toxin-antitoxin system toxin component, PIN family [Phycisphaerae bacterium]
MTAARVVYDTMVFLQAAIHPDRRDTTIEAVEDERLILCTSPELLAEVRDVLSRPALSAKFSALTPERVELFLQKINFMAALFEEVPSTFTWPEHPDDDHLFNLAIASNVKYLVTWENRILKVAQERSPAAALLRQLAPQLSIVTPADLAAELRSQRDESV